MGIINLPNSKKSFNCKKEEVDGVTFLKCEPIERKGDIKVALTEEPIKFRVDRDSGKFELMSDGGADPKTIKELDKYLKFFI